MMYRIVHALILVGIAHGVSIEGTVRLDGKKLGIARENFEAYYGDLGLQLVQNGVIIKETSVDEEGRFVIPSVDTAGNYTVYFTHPRLLVSPVVIVIDEQHAVHAFSHDPIRSNGSVAIAYPLVIVPISNNSPYVPEEPFDALQLLKNPMLIMGLVMVAMVYVLPKLQGNMSAEDMQEMRKGLEDEGGFAASILKNMIPAGADSSKQTSLKDTIPSISGENETRKRK